MVVECNKEVEEKGDGDAVEGIDEELHERSHRACCLLAEGQCWARIYMPLLCARPMPLKATLVRRCLDTIFSGLVDQSIFCFFFFF
jgi:hypothetical protein